MSLIRKIAKHALRRYERFYRGRYFHLTVDLLLLSVVITLSILLLVLYRYPAPRLDQSTVIHKEKVVSSRTEISTSDKKPKKDLTELSAQAAVYYHSPQGDQLGSGPIPPIAGISTNYWLFFKMENSGNEVDDFVMSAQLPKNVFFTGSKTLSAGTISYQADRHLIIWKINHLAKEKNYYSAGLEIELTPNLQQVGQNCDLATNIRFSAYDREAEQEINGSLKKMTSVLDFDKINQGQGKVEVLK